MAIDQDAQNLIKRVTEATLKAVSARDDVQVSFAPGAHGANRTGRLFTAHALKDLFKCRFYTGVVVFRGQVYTGQHEALVSGELFERVQARSVRRGAHRATSDKPRGLLAGIIKCARCGSATPTRWC
mgnify:CR=1 FL=1